MEIELKPCPFCGGEAIVHDNPDGNWTWFRVKCADCLCETELYTSKKVAVNVWNHRYTPPNAPLTLDELRQMEGEPVYTTRNGWQICYGLTDYRGYLCMETGLGLCIPLDGYGKIWQAYRRRPEEVEK